MSLSMVICERYRELTQNIKSYAEDIIKANKLNARIAMVTENPTEIRKYSMQRTELPNINTYILCVNQGTYMKSLQLSRVIRHNDPNCYIIFISDTFIYCKEAVKYHIEPYDYLSAPVSFEEFKECFLHLYRSYMNHIQFASDCNNICIKSGGSSYKLPKNNVIYVESYEQKLIIHTCDKKYECFGYLKDIIKVLNKCDTSFYRCHKSFIVNLNHIIEVNNKGMYIELSNGRRCLFSRQKKKELKDLLQSMQLVPKMEE
ncbi:MAG: response regulator transcription factor [Bacillota bacterium]